MVFFAISTLAIIVELFEEFTSAHLASLRHLCCSSSYISHCNPMVHICSVHKFHCSPKYIQVCECSSMLYSFVVVSDAQKIYIISFSLSHFLHNQLFYPKLQRNWKGFGVVLLIDSSQNS